VADLRSTDLGEVRTVYGRPALVSLWVLFLMFTVIGWGAYLQEGSLVWLTVGVTVPIVFGTALFRLHRGELAVDAHGTLRMAAMQRRALDLGSLRSVQLSAGLPYPDMSTYTIAHQHGLVVTDASGTEIAFSTQKGGQWRDPGPIVARIIAAVGPSGARCTPRCWELMHAVAELDEPPYPHWLTDPPPDAWGTSIRTSRRTRTGVAIAQWALVSFPLAASVTLALALGPAYPMQAGFGLLGGLAVSGPAAVWLLAVRRRADGAGAT
jgi:hypothetical protein